MSAPATRRSALAALIGGAAALSVPGLSKPPTDEWDDFAKGGEWVFPGIAAAAAAARAAGYHPDDVYCITRPRPGAGAVHGRLVGVGARCRVCILPALAAVKGDQTLPLQDFLPANVVLCSRPGQAPSTFSFAIAKPERVAS